MLVTRHIPHSLMFALLLCGLSSHADAANLDGVFDTGWTTAYQSADSITHMHERLHALGMEHIVLQYAAVEKDAFVLPFAAGFFAEHGIQEQPAVPQKHRSGKDRREQALARTLLQWRELVHSTDRFATGYASSTELEST